MIVLTAVPPVLARMVDDAAMIPPGNATPPEAITAYRDLRSTWCSALVGPVVVPATELADLARVVDLSDPVEVGIRGELADVRRCLARTTAGVLTRELEVPVAKRGENPEPGLHELVELAAGLPSVDVYAEIPLTWGLVNALDLLARQRASGLAVAPKFRTGGLAAELFPTPMELAAVIVACRERELPFKLTTGLHQAVRHNDPETGFTHHGFLNVLVATLAAVEGAEVVDVASLLATLDPFPLVERLRPDLGRERPLWRGFAAGSVPDVVADLSRLGLLGRDDEPASG